MIRVQHFAADLSLVFSTGVDFGMNGCKDLCRPACGASMELLRAVGRGRRRDPSRHGSPQYGVNHEPAAAGEWQVRTQPAGLSQAFALRSG